MRVNFISKFSTKVVRIRRPRGRYVFVRDSRSIDHGAARPCRGDTAIHELDDVSRPEIRSLGNMEILVLSPPHYIFIKESVPGVPARVQQHLDSTIDNAFE